MVLVNDYDRINLPDSTCRLLILDVILRPLYGTVRPEAVVLREAFALAVTG
ncbi:hypothetical protein [Streptomyces sp. 6N106]|uniref:hypothetical protein n=1 Tax=Streptomyces sp. 6N106 TaxID=3457418 RepID=UPI003FD481FB